MNQLVQNILTNDKEWCIIKLEVVAFESALQSELFQRTN